MGFYTIVMTETLFPLSLSPFPVKDSGGREFTWGSLLPKSHEDFLSCWQVPSDHKIWNWLYCISLQKEMKHLRFILLCKLVMQCKDNPYMLSTDLQWHNSCYQPICQIGYAFCQQGTLILCFELVLSLCLIWLVYYMYYPQILTTVNVLMQLCFHCISVL